MKFRYLVIMDYSSSTLDIHKLDNIDNIDENSILNLGYNLNECSWMVCENLIINQVL